MRAFAFATVTAVACTSSPSHPTAPTDLYMADVSVMFPLAKNQAGFDAALAPTSPGVGGAILPQAIFDSAGDDISVDYSSLRAAAFRLDPCFGALGTAVDDSLCQNQLRIVWQPMFFEGSNPEPVSVSDAGVHAFYQISREQLLDAIDELVAARQADVGDRDLGPLAPNTVIASEGLSGALAQSYLQILARYAGGANLIRLTSFEIGPSALENEIVGSGSGIVSADGFWGFQSFKIENGSAVPNPIPTLPDSGPGTSDDQNAMDLDASLTPFESNGSPATTSADSIALLESASESGSATTTAVRASFDAALRIENPHDNSPDTIDCASCHLADPARQFVGLPLGMTATGDTNAFAPEASIPSADLAQTTTANLNTDGLLNLHAFSYRDTLPMINQRVINETANNLAYIQHLLEQ